MNIQKFFNDNFGSLVFLEINGILYTIGRDVGKILEYKEPHKAVKKYCYDSIKYPMLTNGGIQDVTLITEGDIYRMIFKSKMEKAKEFEKWVVSYVLPTLRRKQYFIDEDINKQNLLDAKKEISLIEKRLYETVVYVGDITGEWQPLKKAIQDYELDEEETINYVNNKWLSKNKEVKSEKYSKLRIRLKNNVIYVSDLGIESLCKNLISAKIKNVKENKKKENEDYKHDIF